MFSRIILIYILLQTDNDGNTFEYAEEEPENVTTSNEETSNPARSSSSSESITLLLFLLSWQAIFKVADRAIIVLLKFVKEFLKYLGEICQVDVLVEFARLIPETMYMVYKTINLEKDNFERFAVCPVCKSLYAINDCIKTNRDGSVVSAKCSHVRYPQHPHQSHRRKCGTKLMKTVRSRAGKTFLQPKETYCYKRLTDSLQDLISKKGFVENCEKWRDRQSSLSSNILGDCYEGKVWKDFQAVDDEPFLSLPNNYALMLNIDWFQPTKHGLHSIGVLYLVVMNLPREERFKPENVIIAGIIPGPKKPKLHVNTFLQPLIDELIDLWDGVLLKNSYGGMEKYRAAILGLSSDILATRKCGGFVGHGALRGR